MSRFKGPDAEETVSCNLIPMIDIMFLLLLFFMLGADMSQREIEDVRLPIADKAKEEPIQVEKYKTYTANLLHGDGIACPDHDDQKGSGCRNIEHWRVKIRGIEYLDWMLLRARLEELAKDNPEQGNPPGVNVSADAVMMRADERAPYAVVQRLIQLCSKAGLYKIEVGAAKPAPDGKK